MFVWFAASAFSVIVPAGGVPSDYDYREMRRKFLSGLQGVYVAAFSALTAGSEADAPALPRAVEEELRAAGGGVLTPEDAADKAGVLMSSVVLEGLARPKGMVVAQLSLRLNESTTLLRTGQRVSAETWDDGLTLAVNAGAATAP